MFVNGLTTTYFTCTTIQTCLKREQTFSVKTCVVRERESFCHSVQVFLLPPFHSLYPVPFTLHPFKTESKTKNYLRNILPGGY